MLLHPLVAPTNKGANRRRRRVENADGVFLDQAPETIRLRPVGRAFIHQRRRARRERSVDHIAVPGDPADIRGAPINVVLAQVENVFRAAVNADEIAAGGVQNAFRFSSRSAGVKDVKRMLAVERERGAMRIDIFKFAMPPDVAPFLDVHLVASASENDHAPDRCLALQRFIDVVLQRNDRAAAVGAIGGNDGGRPAVSDPVANAIGAEAAEDDRMNGADPRAGEHGDRGFWNRRQVDDHAIAFANPVSL